MRYIKLHKTLAVVTVMGLIAVSPMSALAATVEQITVEGETGNGTYDAVSNTEAKTGISMSDGSDGTTLNGDVTVKGDVTVTNENSNSTTIEGVDIDSSSDDGYAKLDVKGSVNIDATKGGEDAVAFGINTGAKSDITIGGDVIAKSKNDSTGLTTSSYGTTMNIGGSVTANGQWSYGINADLYGTSKQEGNDEINVKVGGNVAASSGSYSAVGVMVYCNDGNVNIDVSGNVTASCDNGSTGVFIGENKGSVDVKVDGDIQGSNNGIYLWDTGEKASTKITAGGAISAVKGDAIVVQKRSNEEADPEITAWKIESNKGSLVNVFTLDGSGYGRNEDAENRIKSNINYIIKADATENGVTSSNGTIVLKAVEGKLGSVEVGGKTYKTANQDQEIIINVETKKGYKSTVQNNGKGTLTVNEDGSYTLTIPEGGGVDLRAVLEKIEEQRKNSSTRNSDRYSSGSSSSSNSGTVPTVIYAPSTGTQAGDASWSYDNAGWKLKKPDGSFVNGEWRQVSWNGINNWYHFNSNGYADGGWYTDTDGQRYYFYNNHDGAFGRMLTGWNEIDGQWYYFNTIAVNGGSLGSLVTSGTTSDGYQVNADGVWMQ